MNVRQDDSNAIVKAKIVVLLWKAKIFLGRLSMLSIGQGEYNK